MEFKFDSIGLITKEELSVKTLEILDQPLTDISNSEALSLALSCIDLTTLDGNDNFKVIKDLCDKATSYQNIEKGIPSVAAVCVYSNFIPEVKKLLFGKGIKLACVAGGFPSGQGLLESRIFEVRIAKEAGADEIDIIFPRGLLFAGEYNAAFDEICMMRKACSGLTLKVILETGEMSNPLDICRAAEISIFAGADFIKTSTGKTTIGATPEALWIMLKLIKDYNILTGKKIGIKPSGGIGEPETALNCIKLISSVPGKDWLNNSLFRIGASRLADKIYQKLC